MHIKDYLDLVLVPGNVAVAAMQRAGLHIDLARLRETRAAWVRELAEMERYVEGEAAKAGMPFSYSAQHSVHYSKIGAFLFRGLGLEAGKLTPTGAPSTDNESLLEYASLTVPWTAERPGPGGRVDHPVVRAVMRIRSMAKGVGTYLDAFERTARADGACHPKYNWALRTARLSAEDPPVHQIPERSEPRIAEGIKACIVPRVSPAPDRASWDPRRHGFCFRWDIKGAEAAIRAAMLTDHYGVRDPVAYDYIRLGKDIHSKTASIIYEVPEGTYRSGSFERDGVGKPTFFGQIFGGSWRALQWQLWKEGRVRLSDDEAKTIVANFAKGYPGIAALYEVDKTMLGERMDDRGLSWCEDAYGRRRAIQVPPALMRRFKRGAWSTEYEQDYEQMRKLSHAFHVAANCLDAETEALTKRGWIKGFDLLRDDMLLTKNASSGQFEWQQMLDLKLWPDYHGPLVEFRSKSFHAVSTPAHRWLVRERYGVNKKIVRDIEVTTETFSPYGEQAIHLTGDYRPKISSVLSPDEAELMGWWLTDGYIIKCREGEQKTRGKRVYKRPTPRASLCQSVTANASKCRRIDALLTKLSAHKPGCRRETKTTYKGLPYRCANWNLGPTLSAKLIGLCPARVLTFDLLGRLDRLALDRLREAMVLGDGCVSGGVTTFCSGSQAQIEAFQALCTLTGDVASIRKRDLGKYDCNWTPPGSVSWYAKVLTRTHAQVLRRRRRFTARRAVWCPVVQNTFFVARRSGTVFVTGNTPTQSINASDAIWMLALCCLGEYVDLRVPPVWARDGIPFPEAAGWQLHGGPGPGGKPFQAWHVNAVHDSGWGDGAPGYLEPTAKLLWRRCTSVPLDWRLEADVPYRIELKVGPDMSDMRPYNAVAKQFNLEPVEER